MPIRRPPGVRRLAGGANPCRGALSAGAETRRASQRTVPGRAALVRRRRRRLLLPPAGLTCTGSELVSWLMRGRARSLSLWRLPRNVSVLVCRCRRARRRRRGPNLELLVSVALTMINTSLCPSCIPCGARPPITCTQLIRTTGHPAARLRAPACTAAGHPHLCLLPKTAAGEWTCEPPARPSMLGRSQAMLVALSLKAWAQAARSCSNDGAWAAA